MRASSRIALFLLILFLMSWVPSLAHASPVLIKLELTGEAELEAANRLDVAVYHKLPLTPAGGELIIAEFEKSNLGALEREALAYEIIDEQPWSEGYYLISQSKRTEKVSLTQYGRVLVSYGQAHFMKISDENAWSLAGQGHHIVKVFRHRLPLKYKSQKISLPAGSAPPPHIDSLLPLVSEDSLYAWDLRLQNFQTRYSYSDSIRSARQWLLDKFQSFGIDSVWFHHYSVSDQCNVVATVVGTAMPDRVIVIGGHYDSFVWYGPGSDPLIWAPGADDNGTGTVATLEMARIIAQHPLPVTVMFVAFAQEEQGLLGSDHFAEHLYNEDVDVQLMINSDMIGHSVDADPDVGIAAAPTAINFANIMMAMANTYTSLRPFYAGQHYGSDHHSFYQWGYDAVDANEGDFFYYGAHTNYDVVDSLDFNYVKEVVKMCLATAVTVARDIGSMPGDATWDGTVNVADVVYLLNYLYKGGPAPDPVELGDFTCDGIVDSDDVVFLINYLFRDGPAPPPSC